MSDQGERDGRWTDMNESDAPHDVWGKVEESDVRVAPESDEFSQLDDEGGGESRYVAPAAPGTGQTAKPGRPSSGNWAMPDWMADESAADEKLGSSGDSLEVGGRSRKVLIGAVGLLVVALIAAGCVYLLTRGGDEPAESANKASAAERSLRSEVELPPDKGLERFAGTPTRMLGRVDDKMSGLSYPRFAEPWQVPTKENKLGTPGWSGQQIVVTEKRGGQMWYGQLLTGTLIPSLHKAYTGPGDVKAVAGLAAQGYLGQYYGFQNEKKPLASQALDVEGHKGWLIASYLGFKRDGVQATGEIVATAVVDTGRDAPAVVFASLPNTHKDLWPDLNRFLTQLKVV